MSNPPKVYLLSDGTRITAQGLSDATGLNISACRVRLCKSEDPKFLFRKKGKQSKGREYRHKNYKLDDGTEITVQGLMKKTGMSRQQAGYRLCKYTNPDQVFKKIKSVGAIEQSARERMYSSKPINDPLHCLFMKMKTV